MGLFKKRKKEEIDTRTKIERSFEDKGQEIGRKTGKLAQKAVDKFEEVKQNLEDKGTMDKLRDFSNKVDDTVDKVVDTVTKTTKDVVSKAKSKTKKKNDDEDLYYE